MWDKKVFVYQIRANRKRLNTETQKLGNLNEFEQESHKTETNSFEIYSDENCKSGCKSMNSCC